MSMPQDKVQELLDREPFQSFRIITNSGKEYEVKNPGLVHVMRADVFFVYPKNDRFALIALRNIASIEVEQAAS